jgi:hypothetical protein
MILKKSLTILFILPFLLQAQDSLQVQKHLEAPVVLNGDTLFYFKTSAHTLPLEVRAKEASLRLKRLTSKYNPLIDSLWLKPEDEFSKIMFNNNFVIVTTKKDAGVEILSPSYVATSHGSLTTFILKT